MKSGDSDLPVAGSKFKIASQARDRVSRRLPRIVLCHPGVTDRLQTRGAINQTQQNNSRPQYSSPHSRGVHHVHHVLG